MKASARAFVPYGSRSSAFAPSKKRNNEGENQIIRDPYASPSPSKQILDRSFDGGIYCVPIPVDSPYTTPKPSRFHRSNIDPSPLTVTSHTSEQSPINFRSHSPFGAFLPISPYENDRSVPPPPLPPSRLKTPPPVSPHHFSKPSPSYSSLSVDNTLETASMTTIDSLRTSPALAAISAPPLYRNSPTPSKGFQRPNFRRDSPRVKSPYQQGRKSPFTPSKKSENKNRKARPERSSKKEEDAIKKKTEPCEFYLKGLPCEHGANCDFAHGEHELKFAKLFEKAAAGLCDLERHRTRPCFSWVSTGACPFKYRCACLHPPPVRGDHDSWLTNTVTQGNTLKTDINVDALYHVLQNQIHSGSPFGDELSLDTEAFSDLYKRSCDIKARRMDGVGELAKLKIALNMRGGYDWSYKFAPQHLIHKQVCMVLQEKAFVLLSETKVHEISLDEYDGRITSHVKVHEIAFGPDSAFGARPVSLWFNIGEKYMLERSTTEAQTFRWREIRRTSEGFKFKPSPFDTIQSFVMLRPHDKDAFNLVTDILKHRVEKLETDLADDPLAKVEALRESENQMYQLGDRFEQLKRNWQLWSWPINVGRDHVDAETLEPPVSGEYEIPEKVLHTEAVNHDAAMIESKVLLVWDVFKSTCSTKTNKDQSGDESKRLQIFVDLQKGTEQSEDRNLPHIRNSMFQEQGDEGNSGLGVKSRCWKSLMLTMDKSSDEWYIVRRNFEDQEKKKQEQKKHDTKNRGLRSPTSWSSWKH